MSPLTIFLHNEDRFAAGTFGCFASVSGVAFEVAMIRVSIASPQDMVAIDRAWMRRTAIAVLEGEDIHEAEVSLAFVDNPTIHQLNKRYLQHDEPTDVLSFPLSEANAGRLAGELVIGAEIAKVQAESRGHPVQAELALYVIHGLLHLCGYDEKTSAGAAAMHQRERQYLQQLGLPDIAPVVE